MADNSKFLTQLNKSTRGTLLSLSLQFVLGMIVNLYGLLPEDPKFASESIFVKIAFITHGINGLVLPISALVVVFIAIKTGRQTYKKWAILGLISILIAAAAGISTITLKDDASELASLIMSFGFIASFLSYGKLYISIKSKE